MPPVDYAALARQHGGKPVGSSSRVDYGALAAELGGSPAPVGFQAALAGAETIGATPWHSQGIGGLIGMPGRGPSVRDAIETLPAIGGAIGGAVGAGSGAFAGLGLGALPGTMGGAAFGGEAGEALRQVANATLGVQSPETAAEAIQAMGEQGGIQAAMAGTGHVASRGLAKLAAPFAGSVDPVAQAVAKRQGVTLPASAQTTSKVAPALEGLASKGIGGGRIAERVAEANTSLTRIADTTARRASNLSGPTEIGKAVSDGLSYFKASFRQQRDRLFAQAALPERGLKLQAKDTVALLDDIIATKESAGSILKAGPTADISFYRGLRDGLTKTAHGRLVGDPAGSGKVNLLKNIEAKDLLNAKRELAEKIKGSFADPFAAANKGTLQKVAATMDDDFWRVVEAKAPDLAVKLRTANAAYAEGISKINSSFGKSINKLAKAGQYDKISQAVANSRMSVADIPKVLEVAGPEGANGIRATVLTDIFAKAKSPTGQGFKPLAINQEIARYGEDRLKALMTPEQFSTLKDLGTLSASMQRGAKISEGSQTAFLARHGGQIAAAFVNPVFAIKAMLGDVAFNSFIGSSAGQRWLTTGMRVPPAVTKSLAAAAHAGSVPLQTRPATDEH